MSAAAPTSVPPRLDGALRGPIPALLAVLLFAMVNYVASRHYRRWDWTAASRFTLSPRSAEVARGLRAPVEMYVLMGRNEGLYADVSELAERYSAASPRVRLHYIDPDRQRERLIALANETHLQLVENRETGATLSTAAIVVVRGEKHWEVSREQMRELGTSEGDDEGSAARVEGARITVERSITEALLQVDRASSTKLCLATGHAEMPITTGDHAGAGLVDDLRHNNLVVQEVEVHGQTVVPAECEALLIAGPQRAWPPEDAQVVERYLRSGGNVGMFLDPVTLEGRVVPTGLERVAALGGIGLPAALVVEADADHLLPDTPPLNFRVDTWNEHEITRSLRASSMLAEMVRPVVRAEGGAVVPQTLAQTTGQAWGETDIADLLHTFRPVKARDDVQGPVAIAMASTVPGATSRGQGVASGRLVVVGTSNVVGSDFFQLQVRARLSNADFAEAVVGWLTSRRELVDIPSRPMNRAALMVSDQSLKFVALYVLALVPLAAALVGIAVWRARKVST